MELGRTSQVRKTSQQTRRRQTFQEGWACCYVQVFVCTGVCMYGCMDVRMYAQHRRIPIVVGDQILNKQQAINPKVFNCTHNACVSRMYNNIHEKIVEKNTEYIQINTSKLTMDSVHHPLTTPWQLARPISASSMA